MTHCRPEREGGGGAQPPGGGPRRGRFLGQGLNDTFGVFLCHHSWCLEIQI